MNNETTQTEFYDPSPQGSFYLAHSALMEPLQRLPEDKVFVIGKNDNGAAGEPVSLRVLCAIADRFTVGKKAYVVIEHSDVFEVRRLKDGESATLFYKFANPIKKIGEIANLESEAEANVLQTILHYKSLNYDDLKGYDKSISSEMKANGVIAYSYISRKVAATAAFRNSEKQTGLLLKECIASLIEKGIIEPVSKDITKAQYNVTAQLYKVIENAN